MRFTVDPWDPGYGASVQTELAESTSVPTTDIECDPTTSGARSRPAGASPAPTPSLFVDGVRRIEARAWIEGGIEPVPGVFASWAAGVVRCDGDAQDRSTSRSARGVFAPGGRARRHRTRVRPLRRDRHHRTRARRR